MQHEQHLTALWSALDASVRAAYADPVQRCDLCSEKEIASLQEGVRPDMHIYMPYVRKRGGGLCGHTTQEQYD